MDRHTQTQSIESKADPDAVVGLLAQPNRIPEWAPAFADAVIADDRSGWRAIKDGREFDLRVVVNRGTHTVDYLREVAPAATEVPTSEPCRVLAAAASSS